MNLESGGGEVDIRIRVRSITPISRLMLIRNGELVQDIPLPEDRRQIDYSTSIEITDSSWVHVRAEGLREESFPLDTGFAQAFTNPTWIIVDGRAVRSLESANYSIEWIDKLTEMARAEPGWRSQAEKDHVFGQFDEARALYEQFRKEASERASQPAAR